jgi:three-Cys-motif partner protein
MNERAMKDINSNKFTDETKLKLDIFKKCFREWFPVFLNDRFTKSVFIYDLFAGSGTDSEGNFGSPLWFLSEARGEGNKYCEQICSGNTPHIIFAFNELVRKKEETLKQNVDLFFEGCKKQCSLNCTLKNNVHFKSDPFKEIASNDRFKRILGNKKYAKFIILDQYGVKQITEPIFKELINSPKTDFIFFIASSVIKRFSKHKAIKKYFNENKINFDKTKPNECHKQIAQYYRSLVPQDKEYYIHQFTIKKGANYYGLIFGTGHTLGMEKFLRVCWEEDKLAGESNCNVDNDFLPGSLFYNPESSNKINEIKKILVKEILSGGITDNITGMKYALRHGCQPKVFVDVIQELIKKGKVRIEQGYKFNKRATNIHKIEVYRFIKV